MVNTYTSLHYHVLFSTRNREPWILRASSKEYGHSLVALLALTR